MNDRIKSQIEALERAVKALTADVKTDATDAVVTNHACEARAQAETLVNCCHGVLMEARTRGGPRG